VAGDAFAAAQSNLQPFLPLSAIAQGRTELQIIQGLDGVGRDAHAGADRGDGGSLFVDLYAPTGALEGAGRGQTADSRSDDDGRFRVHAAPLGRAADSNNRLK
jgi:hypothetical protein